jgi:N-acetylglucosamine-6-phosphate deacetylase
MRQTTFIARHYATGQPVRVRMEAGRVAALDPARRAPQDLWVAPSLVDLQINGYGGVDFQQDALTVRQLLSAIRQLRADGCGRFLLTLITDEWPRLIARLRHHRGLRSASSELQQAIAGWHIEGPFLSPEPGFHGAHDPALMVDPTPTRLRELRDAAGRDPVLLTLAPERKGAIKAITLARSLGMRISLGHTNATAGRLQAALRAGAAGFTHLGNGCPRELDRHDNILWRALDTPGLTVSLIPDGHHVSPPLFRLLHRVLDPARILYTTDAMAAAGAGPGRYALGELVVEVGDDQIVRQPGRSNFAGSALRPMEGVFRAARMLHCPWQKAWQRLSENPAAFMGWDGSLGKACQGACLLRVGSDNRLIDLRAL